MNKIGLLALLYGIYFLALLPTMFIIIRSVHAYFSSFSSVLSAGSCLPLRSSAFPTLCTYVRARLRTFFMFLCTARFSLPKYNWRCDAPVFPSLSTPRPPPPSDRLLTTSCSATSLQLIPWYRLPRIPARATLTRNTLHKVVRCVEAR